MLTLEQQFMKFTTALGVELRKLLLYDLIDDKARRRHKRPN
jgi:hypothetical protein